MSEPNRITATEANAGWNELRNYVYSTPEIQLNSIREAMEHQRAERQAMRDTLLSNAIEHPRYRREYLAEFTPTNIGETMSEPSRPDQLMDISKEIGLTDNTLTLLKRQQIELETSIRGTTSGITEYELAILNYKSNLSLQTHEQENLRRVLENYVPTNNWRKVIKKVMDDVKTTCKAFNFVLGGFQRLSTTQYRFSFLKEGYICDGMLIPPMNFLVETNIETGLCTSFKSIRVMREVGRYAHPHIWDRTGVVCLGNGSSLLADCRSIFDYVSVHMAAINQYNPDSPYEVREVCNLNVLCSASRYAEGLKAQIQHNTNVMDTKLDDVDLNTNNTILPAITCAMGITRRSTDYWKASTIYSKLSANTSFNTCSRSITTANGSKSVFNEIFYDGHSRNITHTNYTQYFPKELTKEAYLSLKNNGYTSDFLVNLEIVKNLMDINDETGSWYDTEAIYEFNKGYICSITRTIVNNMFKFLKLINDNYSDEKINDIAEALWGYDCSKTQNYISDFDYDGGSLSDFQDSLHSEYIDNLREFKSQETSTVTEEVVCQL